MTDDLLHKKCLPCEGGILPFDISEIHKYQKKVDGWNIIKDEKKIFFIEKNKMKKIYDGYNKKNQRSIKHLLNKYIKSNKINDINSNIETYKLLFKISSKLKSINNV